MSRGSVVGTEWWFIGMCVGAVGVDGGGGGGWRVREGMVEAGWGGWGGEGGEGGEECLGSRPL